MEGMLLGSGTFIGSKSVDCKGESSVSADMAVGDNADDADADDADAADDGGGDNKDGRVPPSEMR